MRVVVVGATGNVGTAVLRRLAAARLAGDGRAGSDEGLQVVGVARRLPDARVAPYDVAVWHTVDVGGDGAVEELAAVFRGADAVVHLAWALQPTHDIPTQHRTKVRGTANVLAAVARAGVQQVVVVSSVGAYRGVDVDGKRTPVDESFPTTGIPTATYSVHKAENERALDTFEREHPDVVVTRLRPGLVFQRSVAAELRGLFLGHLVPMSVVRAARFAVLPLPLSFVFQAVHADDLADAFWRAIDRRTAGAFNIAASPVLTPPRMARAAGMLGAVRIPLRLLRGVVTLTWRLRLQPTDAGWLDIAAGVPVMQTDRARNELGWAPQHTAEDALRELVGGFADGARVPASGPLRG
ncbi:NAD-dependent epimerase/dehydratase family protein [Curtobacterium sp. Csp1]|uniref:NAD-dependent epimerase/dehydratase family protein n=1 Tax=unclassified Curtobacterium TaxID=257496 RepID=UPI00159A0BA1|nr:MULTISPECIES: NAD-dependent epimerase/dehydratase family protein [unclassified Curtobacterium]QKS12675.1 NAD-dependent epimerase/dehydratase family protein [Curtobacterium sp. csp3]QKS20281.1 NAD-dependent epimerase/dehydratase family protein [Curtobacterium sp. Csp1]